MGVDHVAQQEGMMQMGFSKHFAGEEHSSGPHNPDSAAGLIRRGFQAACSQVARSKYTAPVVRRSSAL